MNELWIFSNRLAPVGWWRKTGSYIFPFLVLLVSHQQLLFGEMLFFRFVNQSLSEF
jgi:hypothetical protein